jgi:shikimate kinase
VVATGGGAVLREESRRLMRERGYDNPDFIVYGDVTPL